MSIDLQGIFPVVAAMDPYRWQWRDAEVAVPPGATTLYRRLERARASAATAQYQRGIGALADLLQTADTSRPFSLPLGLPPLNGRLPIVLAHGPSLSELIPAISSARDRLYVIAPFRTALRLADCGIVADVITLADAHFYVNGISVRTWRSTPAPIRERLIAESALLIEPFAPSEIYNDFARVHIFDDGTGWLPKQATLPFWGSSLLPSLCLPLRLGATRVAIGGVDLGAASGERARTWTGAPMRRDPAMSITHQALEAIAQALPGTFVDLSINAIAKRGFKCTTIDAVLTETSPVAHAPARSTTTCTLRNFIVPVLEAAQGLGSTIDRMATVAERVCSLASEGQYTTELEALVAQMETDWSTDRACIAALSLAQPPYLRSLWQLRAAGVQPRNRALATRMKARLIGPEIAAVAPAYARCIDTLRRSIAAA